MKTVNQMTVKEIIESIEVMRNGLSLNPGEREKQILTKNIERAQLELQKRSEQKKTENQASEKSEQLPQKQEMERLAKEIEREAVQKNRMQEQSAKAFEPERRVIAKIENPEPLTVPVVEIEFKDAKGNIYIRTLDQSDILTLLKTYFKRVATSAKMDAGRYSEAYNSEMGKMVYKLFRGWNLIYNETGEGEEWPPKEEVFPGLSRASQQQKVNAEILWRWASNDK